MHRHSLALVFEALVVFIHGLSTALAVALGGYRGRHVHPALAAIAIVILGVLLGVLTTAFFPSRISSSTGGLVAGLAAMAVLVAVAMALLGRWIRSWGGDPSPVASLWGGALFGVAIGLTRWAVLEAM